MAGSLTVQSSTVTETAIGNANAQTKQIGPITISAAGNITGSQDIALAIGDNVITSPAGATIAVIILTANPNTSALTLKGLAADTGIVLNATATIPAIVTFANPVAANVIHINSSAAGATINVSYL